MHGEAGQQWGLRGSAWAAFDVAPHGDGLWVRVEAPYCYGYKWYARPDYRGRGIIGKMTLLRDMYSAGA